MEESGRSRRTGSPQLGVVAENLWGSAGPACKPAQAERATGKAAMSGPRYSGQQAREAGPGPAINAHQRGWCDGRGRKTECDRSGAGSRSTRRCMSAVGQKPTFTQQCLQPAMLSHGSKARAPLAERSASTGARHMTRSTLSCWSRLCFWPPCHEGWFRRHSPCTERYGQ